MEYLNSAMTIFLVLLCIMTLTFIVSLKFENGFWGRLKLVSLLAAAACSDILILLLLIKFFTIL